MEELNSPKLKVVLFHSNRCGYCHAMRPEWDKFATKNDSNTLDIEQEQLIGHPIQEQISGFPTIVKMKNGHIIKSFNGDRTEHMFSKFLKEYCGLDVCLI